MAQSQVHSTKTLDRCFFCSGRSHAMTEPVIIAANRHLSKMHPIHQLMLPHFKYTCLINATARQTLIGAGGAFEALFTPGQHFLELVLSYYKNVWNFEGQALPEDLLSRYTDSLHTPLPFKP